MSEKNPFCKLDILEYRRVEQTKNEMFLENQTASFIKIPIKLLNSHIVKTDKALTAKLLLTKLFLYFSNF